MNIWILERVIPILKWYFELNRLQRDDAVTGWPGEQNVKGVVVNAFVRWKEQAYVPQPNFATVLFLSRTNLTYAKHVGLWEERVVVETSHGDDRQTSAIGLNELHNQCIYLPKDNCSGRTSEKHSSNKFPGGSWWMMSTISFKLFQNQRHLIFLFLLDTVPHCSRETFVLSLCFL